MIEQRIPHAPLYYRVERHDYRKREVIYGRDPPTRRHVRVVSHDRSRRRDNVRRLRSRADAAALRHSAFARRKIRARRRTGPRVLRVRVRTSWRGAGRDLRAADLDRARCQPRAAPSSFSACRRRATEYHRGALGFAIQARGSAVERHFHSVYDLTPERIGTYDLVFCASVLLHLTDPLRALYGIRRVCRDQAIISTGHRHAIRRRSTSRSPCSSAPPPARRSGSRR